MATTHHKTPLRLLRLRNTLIAIGLLTLGGCNIEITVPTGATVVSASGIYTCEAGSQCTVRVVDLLFDETFSVQLSEGYRFDGWLRRDRGLCGGTTAPCRLFTSGLAGNPVLEAILVSDSETFYLEPVVSLSQTDSPDQPGLEPAANWLINTTERSTYIFESSTSSLGVVEDVQLAEERSVDGVPYLYVETEGIPSYDVLVTEELLAALNGRPLAARDFGAGISNTSVGETLEFGQDIGYNSSTSNCDTTGGAGYWPPGPECPVGLGRAEYFAAEPQPAAQTCESGLGTTGLLVNGTAVFNWGDGQSFGNGVWYNLAPIAEQYDVDVCGGHAANGEYHHHFYTSCLAELLQDEGTDHSPIYGFAADGYPIYGPWEDDEQLAISGWAVRDYGAAPSAGGCGTPGERSCILADAYDLSQGVDSTVAAGPDIGETVSTLSGNSLEAFAGYYFEDYYASGAATGGPQLDAHNGHDNDDGRGYHYHITLEQAADGTLTPAFPFTIGPRFYGELPDNAVTSCGGGGAPPGGPGAGGPPRDR